MKASNNSTLRYKTDIYFQHQTLFALCEKLLNLSFTIIDRINEKKHNTSINKNYAEFLSLILVRTTNVFEGVLILCNEGQRTNALCLLRIIVESLINLKYVQTDKEELSELFLNYGTVGISRYFELSKMEDPMPTSHLEKELDKAFPVWRNILEKVKSKYNPKWDNWSGKSVKNMADLGKVLELYPDFRFLSEISHPSVAAVANHTATNAEGSTIQLQEDTETINSALASAFKCYFNILVNIKNGFEIKLDKEFVETFKEFQLLSSESKTQTPE